MMQSNHEDALRLMLAYLDGRATADEARQLSEMMRHSESLRKSCAEMARQHLQLFELGEEQHILINELEGEHAETETRDHLLEKSPSVNLTRIVWRVVLPMAACVLLMVMLFLQFSSDQTRNESELVVIDVLEIENLALVDQTELIPGQQIALKHLEIESGILIFGMTSGVKVQVNGPADIQLTDPMQLLVDDGQITVDVGPTAKGFTVVTSNAHIVDLGTRFGVDVSGGGAADVVVFEGEVDVCRLHQTQRDVLAKLKTGEAVRVIEQGQVERVTSVTTRDGQKQWSTRNDTMNAVVTAVSDNVIARERWSYRFYPIIAGGMEEGVQAWPYEDNHNQPRWWSQDGKSMPEWLQGADVIQMLQQELSNRELEISLILDRPATVYVFYEKGAPIPVWLNRDFVNTGFPLRMSPDPIDAMENIGRAPKYSVAFEVWKRVIPQGGEVHLGAVTKQDVNSPPFYMYGVAVRELR